MSEPKQRLSRAEAPPFGMSPAQPAFDRATWLAKRLFGALESVIVLVDGGSAWRSRAHDNLPPVDPATDRVLASGELLWIEDARHPACGLAEDPTVTGPMQLRSYVGAPIRLGDGTVVGALCVVDREPRPYDELLAKDLRTLAEGVASECDRAKALVAAARNEAELDRAKAVLSTLLDALPASVMMTDREMRLIHVSPRWQEIMGYTSEAVLGRSVYDVEPDYFLRFKKAYDRCLAGETIRADKVRSVRNGRTGWLQTELVPWRDTRGKVGGIIVVATQITEMVEAIEQMKRTEERLNIALEIADIHVYEVDYIARTLTTAGATDVFFERRQQFEDFARDLYGAVDPRDVPAVKAAWEAHMRDGVPFRPQYRVARSDGKEIWGEGALTAITNDEGRIVRLIGAVRDVTPVKKHERELMAARDEAETANRAKSTFLATMSHEIRTPLNGVLGMAQAMAADDLPPVQRERLDVIRQSGETLLAILNDVLDLSKIEAGKLELEMVEFDLAELARGAHAAFTAIANKKGLSFDLVLSASAGGVWRGDSTRVRQILYNLVSNALKFTEEGEVKVDLDRTAQGLELRVRDTGIGMSKTEAAKLFQKFEQADASTTRRFGGTGLGLSICRELATLMGGGIKVTSSPGKGSTFTATLPLERVRDAEARTETDAAASPDPTTCGPLKVLAAEDNRVNQLVLKTLLHQIGLDPVVVDNGRAALAAWEDEPWDVILMDVQMPEMDGPTATARIREREAATGRSRTPIIALTANAMAHQVAEYRAAGMDDFVAKPIEIAKLFAALQAVLPADDAEAA